jgi:hypothetical protein
MFRRQCCAIFRELTVLDQIYYTNVMDAKSGDSDSTYVYLWIRLEWSWWLPEVETCSIAQDNVFSLVAIHGLYRYTDSVLHNSMDSVKISTTAANFHRLDLPLSMHCVVFLSLLPSTCRSIHSTSSERNTLTGGFGRLAVSMLPSGTRVRRFKTGRSRRIFWAKKILSMPSFGGEVKPSVPCRSFAAC